jgi:hypothetical protein
MTAPPEPANGLSGRHFRAGFGAFLMLVGVTTIFMHLLGKEPGNLPGVPTTIYIFREVMVHVMPFAAGWAMFDPTSFKELLSRAASLIPGKGGGA